MMNASQTPLLGILPPRPIPFAPALALVEKAQLVYQEIANRFTAYARSLDQPLPLANILGAILWTQDRLSWLAARLESGVATFGEYEIAAALHQSALSIFEIMQRWLVIDGGDPAWLNELSATLSRLELLAIPPLVETTLPTTDQDEVDFDGLYDSTEFGDPEFAASSIPADQRLEFTRPIIPASQPAGIGAIAAIAALIYFVTRKDK